MEYVFGLHAVTALLETSPGNVAQVYCQKGRQDKRMQELLDLASQCQVKVQWLPRKALDDMASGRHQGVIAEATMPRTSWSEEQLYKEIEALDHPPLLLILDGVTDPHNLGACLRSADAAGVDAVITTKDNAADLNATVRKVACGAAEVIPFVRVTNLARTLEKLKQQGVWLYGTAGEADSNLYEADLKGPVGLIMGAEGKGMRRLTREHCDYLIKLPMAGNVSSLNVSVATGVCLFEVVRQRQA